MTISRALQQFLDDRGVTYDIFTHTRTLSACEAAHACAIPEENVAKGVLMRRNGSYLLAIIPASRHVEFGAVSEWAKQPCSLATEAEVGAVFDDCDLGAIPPVAGAYGLSAVMDDCLEGFNDIYFDGGDHCSLVHVTGRDFHRATAEVPHAHISAPNH